MLEDIEIKLVRGRLRWLGHLCRMGDDRPAKQLLYHELVMDHAQSAVLNFENNSKMWPRAGCVTAFRA